MIGSKKIVDRSNVKKLSGLFFGIDRVTWVDVFGGRVLSQIKKGAGHGSLAICMCVGRVVAERLGRCVGR